MRRRLYLTLGSIAVAMAGCGGSSPPAAPPAPPTAGGSSQSPSVSSATVDVRPSPATPPPQVERKQTVSPLRALAAGYLESDGPSGWRKNEATATELEKLEPEQMAQLWPLLADEQVEVRRGTAVFLLAQFNPADSDHVAAFSKLLDDSDRTVRSMGINALRQFRRDDQIAALPRIAKLLDPQHEDRPENRTAAARICGSLKSDAAPALAMLQVAAMNDPDAKVRGPAFVAIAQIAAPEQAVSSLSKGLKDNDAAVRLVAAVRLRQLGVQAAPAVHELAAVLADSNNDVAESAAETLILIGTPAVQPVAEQLSSRNVSARKLALACLAKIGVAAKETVPKIEACQRDADPQVRQLAEAALKRIRGQ